MGASTWAKVCLLTALHEVISWTLIHVHVFQSEKIFNKKRVEPYKELSSFVFFIS